MSAAVLRSKRAARGESAAIAKAAALRTRGLIATRLTNLQFEEFYRVQIIKHKAPGQDHELPVYGPMKVNATGQIGEFVSCGERVFELKMSDGTIRQFHRKELEYADAD
jgi:hypothetical protein